MKRSRSERRKSGAAEAAIEAALARAVPGFELLDRELSCGGGWKADLAGVDGGGRVVLVLVVSEEEHLAGALGLLAFARRSGALIASHLSLAPEAALDPRVLLVARERRARLRARLELLAGLGLEAFEIQTLASAAGESTALVPIGPHGPALARASEPASPGTSAGLGGDLRELASLAGRRIARIDDRIEHRTSGDETTWTFLGRELCGLRVAVGRLEGRIGEAAPQPIAAQADLDLFLEGVVEHYLDRTGGFLLHGRASAGGRDREPVILTPEEIEAFRS